MILLFSIGLQLISEAGLYYIIYSLLLVMYYS